MKDLWNKCIFRPSNSLSLSFNSSLETFQHLKHDLNRWEGIIWPDLHPSGIIHEHSWESILRILEENIVRSLGWKQGVFFADKDEKNVLRDKRFMRNSMGSKFHWFESMYHDYFLWKIGKRSFFSLFFFWKYLLPQEDISTQNREREELSYLLSLRIFILFSFRLKILLLIFYFYLMNLILCTILRLLLLMNKDDVFFNERKEIRYDEWWI